jgi:transposase
MPACTREKESKKQSQRAVQPLFYIPAYSPDFNPIEQFFAKLKSVLRKIAAYTLKGIAFKVDGLCKAIVSCLDKIARSECAAYLANSGYGQPKREML